MHVLVARIEPAGVAGHASQASLLLLGEHGLGIGPAVDQRNLDLDMLARRHAGNRLRGMHLGGRAQDDGIDIVARQRLFQLGARMARTVFGGDLGCLFGAARDDRDDLDPVDQHQAVEVLFAECAGACEGNSHNSHSINSPSHSY